MIPQLLSSSFQVLIPQVISPLRSKSIRFLECWRWSRLEPEMAFSPVDKCFSKRKFAPEQSALRRNWRHQATHLLSSFGTFFTLVSLSRHWFSSKSTFTHTQSARDFLPGEHSHLLLLLLLFARSSKGRDLGHFLLLLFLVIQVRFSDAWSFAKSF